MGSKRDEFVNHYPHHIGDYRRDTGHLSLLEHGIYRQLLDTYYLSETAIPKETDLVMRRLRADTEVEQKAVLTVLREFFEDTPEGWIHRRCEAEIARYRAKAKQAKLNGIKGGRPKKPKETNPVNSRNQKETGSKANQEPITKNQEPINTKRGQAALCARPADVPEKIWTDFLAIRKSKRAPLTQTALDGIATEARKAGLSLADALGECCARGWQGFKADWMGSGANKKPIGNKQERLEAANREVAAGWKPPELRHANG
jgi:uncharacterized protein YdaU (DUF1376 family)